MMVQVSVGQAGIYELIYKFINEVRVDLTPHVNCITGFIIYVMKCADTLKYNANQ